MQHIEVGQVIYVLDQKKNALIPGRIHEQITAKTLNGVNVHHILWFADSKTVVLENISAPWFNSVDDAKEYLLQVASDMIDRVVSKAVSIAQDKFPEVEPLPTTFPNAPDTPDASFKMDLGDGQVANIKVPEELFKEPQSIE